MFDPAENKVLENHVALSAEKSRRNLSSTAALQFDFPFEELALIVADGFEAGLVNGYAEISIFSDGVNDDPEWIIGGIFLDGYFRRDCRPIEVERNSPIYRIIYDQLENDAGWSEKITDRMIEKLREVA